MKVVACLFMEIHSYVHISLNVCTLCVFSMHALFMHMLQRGKIQYTHKNWITQDLQWMDQLQMPSVPNCLQFRELKIWQIPAKKKKNPKAESIYICSYHFKRNTSKNPSWQTCKDWRPYRVMTWVKVAMHGTQQYMKILMWWEVVKLSLRFQWISEIRIRGEKWHSCSFIKCQVSMSKASHNPMSKTQKICHIVQR